MKVLVTGGAEYVGSHAVRELVAARHVSFMTTSPRATAGLWMESP